MIAFLILFGLKMGWIKPQWFVKQFAREVLQELNTEEPMRSVWFNKHRGLCTNWFNWFYHRFGKRGFIKQRDAVDMVFQLRLNEYAKKHKRINIYPFNEGPIDFHRECANTTIFLNNERLNWLKEQAK